MFVRKFFSIGWILILLSVVAAAEIGAETEKLPISITAENMTAQNEKGLVVFEGNVVLTKGAFTLKADRLEVKLAPANQAGEDASKETGTLLSEISRGQEAISSMEAIGRVEVSQEGRHGKSDRAIYDHEAEKVILIGDPEVWSPEYRVRGTRMTFYLNDQKNVVEDTEAVIYPNN